MHSSLACDVSLCFCYDTVLFFLYEWKKKRKVNKAKRNTFHFHVCQYECEDLKFRNESDPVLHGLQHTVYSCTTGRTAAPGGGTLTSWLKIVSGVWHPPCSYSVDKVGINCPSAQGKGRKKRQDEKEVEKRGEEEEKGEEETEESGRRRMRVQLSQLFRSTFFLMLLHENAVESRSVPIYFLPHVTAMGMQLSPQLIRSTFFLTSLQ